LIWSCAVSEEPAGGRKSAGLVEGIEKPIINKGYIMVPDKPGLGITLNEEG